MSTFIDKVKGNDIGTGVEKLVLEEIGVSEEEMEADNDSSKANETNRQRYHTLKDHIKAKYFPQ